MSFSELKARFKPGENVPVFCAAQVNAGHFVKINGAKVNAGLLDGTGDIQVVHCSAAARAFGVAERDSGPATDPARSWTRRVNVVRAGAVARVVAGAAVAAGASVESDATGRAVTLDAGVALGQVVGDAAAAAGDILEVALF